MKSFFFIVKSFIACISHQVIHNLFGFKQVMVAILDFRSTQKIKNFVNHHPMIINGINQDSIL
jgi:hypothetical protein